jgi:ankyrin repeat protein
MSIFEDEDVKSFCSDMTGVFHNDYDLYGSPIDLLNEIKKDKIGLEEFRRGLDKILNHIDSMKEIKYLVERIGYEYCPDSDGKTHLEWLVFVKNFMK